MKERGGNKIKKGKQEIKRKKRYNSGMWVSTGSPDESHKDSANNQKRANHSNSNTPSRDTGTFGGIRTSSSWREISALRER
jgi:hypothetical protein